MVKRKAPTTTRTVRPMQVALQSSALRLSGCTTVGTGCGSFEAALWEATAAFGGQTGELADIIIEYDPQPPFGKGTVETASSEAVAGVVVS
jgi:hypothetical protein